jgi:hypothetical protein
VGSNPAGGAWLGILKIDHDKLIEAILGDFPHLMGSDEVV